MLCKKKRSGFHHPTTTRNFHPWCNCPFFHNLMIKFPLPQHFFILFYSLNETEQQKEISLVADQFLTNIQHFRNVKSVFLFFFLFISIFCCLVSSVLLGIGGCFNSNSRMKYGYFYQPTPSLSLPHPIEKNGPETDPFVPKA